MHGMTGGSKTLTTLLRRAKPLAMASVVAAMLLLWIPAASADCPPTDPTCVLDTVNQTINGGSDPGDQVNGTVDSAKDTVTKTTQTVTDTVDGVLHPGGGGPPGGGPGGGGGSGGGSGHGRGSSAKAGPANLLRRTDIPVIPQTPATSSTRPVVAPPNEHQPGFLGRVGGAVAGAAKSVAFPIALALAVIVFLFIQDRLDRRDPKLSLAPVVPDVLGFD